MCCKAPSAIAWLKKYARCTTPCATTPSSPSNTKKTTTTTPRSGSAPTLTAAAKTAAGTENVFPICRARDIEKDLKELAAEGFSILGLDAQGTREAQSVDLKIPLVLVAGGEDRGIPPHIGRTLTSTLRLPMAEGCHSYNASVALALLLYETARQRQFTFEHLSP
mgnify:CR=1 FL=1